MPEPIQTPETPFNNIGVFSFEQLIAANIEAPKPIICGLLYEGQNSILAGPFGIGKTMLATQMSLSIAAGEAFLNREITRPYTVGFIDCENGTGEIRSRVLQQAEQSKIAVEKLKGRWIYANVLAAEGRLWSLSLNDDGIAKLTKFVQEFGIEVLIIDNLGWVLNGAIQDEEDAKRFYTRIRELKKECPCLLHCAFLHHMTKGVAPGADGAVSLLFEPRTYLQFVRGSGRLLDYAETRLAISHEAIGGSTGHVVNGVNRSGGPIEPFILRLKPDCATFVIHEEKAEVESVIFAKAPKMLALWKALPDEFTFTFARNLVRPDGGEYHNNTVSEMLKRARAHGLVSSLPDESYRKIRSSDVGVTTQ